MWSAVREGCCALRSESTSSDIFVRADAHHRFVPEECDWGFTRFHDLRKLYNAQDHQKRPIIEDDAAEVTVFVRVLKDPTGVLWHNFQKYMTPPPSNPMSHVDFVQL